MVSMFSGKTEELIRESQLQLKSVTSTIPGVLYQHRHTPNGDDYFVYLSEGVEDVFEIPYELAFNDLSKVFLKYVARLLWF